MEEELESRRSGNFGGPHGLLQFDTDFYFLDDMVEIPGEQGLKASDIPKLNEGEKKRRWRFWRR
jgi:hypothetical protein